MSELYEKLTRLASASIRMKNLAEQANTAEARRPYSDPRIEPVPESQWGQLVDNYLGGEIGQHCKAWTPAVAIAVAKALEDFIERYETELDAPQCPNCGSYCAGHAARAYHVACAQEVADCACLRVYLELAETFLGGR